MFSNFVHNINRNVCVNQGTNDRTSAKIKYPKEKLMSECNITLSLKYSVKITFPNIPIGMIINNL